MAGKKKSTVGYYYFLGFHLVFCHGPIDKALQFLADKKIAWSGETTGGTIGIFNLNLFGGDEKEGGIGGLFDFEFGRFNQGQNPYLQLKLLPELVPAFRGLFGVVAHQAYIGTSTYLKNMAVRASRIHTRTALGLTQWYDTKAEINSGGADDQIITVNGGGNTGANVFLANPVIISGYQTSDRIHLTLPPDSYPNVAWNICSETDPALMSNPDSSGPYRSRVMVTTDDLVSIEYGTHPDSSVWWRDGYKTIDAAYASWPGNIILTGSTAYRFWLNDDQPDDDGGSMVFRIVMDQAGPDMNPAHIIRECLTDPDWGMGYQDGDIDDTSFMAAADTLYNERFGLSMLWTKQTTIEQFVTEIVKHIDASIYLDRSTGKFNLKLIRADFDSEGLIELNPSNIEKIDNFVRPTTGELTNSVTVKYTDNLHNVEASITVQDIALVQMQQATIGTTVDYPGITTSSLASRVAQRDLKTLSTPIASCTLYCNREAASLNIGQPFKMTWPDYDMDSVVMRVTGIAYGDGNSNKVRITCTQDIYSLPAIPMIVPDVPDLPPISPAPTPATKRLPYELPYLEAVQQSGQVSVDNAITANADIAYVGIAAGVPAQGTFYGNMYVDSGAGYNFEATVDFSPTAALVANIGKMNTTFTIKNPVEVDLTLLSSWFQIDDEIMSLVSLAGDVLTVKRGILDTVPASHALDSVLYFWDRYATSDSTAYAAGEEVSIKITTVTGQGELALAGAPVDTIDVVGRMAMPYPPANVKINDEYYPVNPIAPITATWVHRDRRMQTGSVYLGFTDGTVGPETGTTYNIYYYDDTDTLIHSELGITGTASTPFSPSVVATTDIRVELESERDGIKSFQRYSHIFTYLFGEQRVTEDGANNRMTENGDPRVTE